MPLILFWIEGNDFLRINFSIRIIDFDVKGNMNPGKNMIRIILSTFLTVSEFPF